MKHLKTPQELNESSENLNISDVRSSEKRYKLIEEDPQFRKPGGGLFSPPTIGTIATWNWKHDLYLFGNGEIGNPVSYVNRKQIENNPKWVRI
jgi:hypothetical protein